MKRTAVDQMFRAFSDRTRLRILHLLKDQREICGGDLVSVLEAPQATVSRHLAYLRRAGLVRVRRSGVWKHYSLEPAANGFHRRLFGCLGSCFEEVQLESDVPGRARRRSPRRSPSPEGPGGDDVLQPQVNAVP